MLFGNDALSTSSLKLCPAMNDFSAAMEFCCPATEHCCPSTIDFCAATELCCAAMKDLSFVFPHSRRQCVISLQYFEISGRQRCIPRQHFEDSSKRGGKRWSL